jgi:hypothetical protein
VGKKLEWIIVVKLSALILSLDPESAAIADKVLADAREYARVKWLDEEQNDQAFPYILDELDRLQAPPPDTPVIGSIYGHDEHPKAIPATDPWANAAD